MRLYEQKFTYNRLIIDGIGFLFLCCLLHNCVQLCCLVCSVFRCVFSICYIIIWRRGHIISNLEFNKILSSPSERKLNIIKYTLIKIVYLEDNYSESTFTVTSKLTKHVLWQQHQPMAGSQRWRLATFVVTGKCMSSKGLHSNKPNLFYKTSVNQPPSVVYTFWVCHDLWLYREVMNGRNGACLRVRLFNGTPLQPARKLCSDMVQLAKDTLNIWFKVCDSFQSRKFGTNIDSIVVLFSKRKKKKKK